MYNNQNDENIFEKYGKMYGIDPNLLMAIMCQESSGIHHEYSQNGCAIGGMQIENFWYNKQLTAYNFELQEREEILYMRTKKRTSPLVKFAFLECYLSSF